jgi:hypothetical protein
MLSLELIEDPGSTRHVYEHMLHKLEKVQEVDKLIQYLFIN